MSALLLVCAAGAIGLPSAIAIAEAMDTTKTECALWLAWLVCLLCVGEAVLK